MPKLFRTLEATNVPSVHINFAEYVFSFSNHISAAFRATSAAASAEELLSRSPERGGVGLGLQRELQLREELKSPIPAAKPLLKDLNELDERLSIIVTDKRIHIGYKVLGSHGEAGCDDMQKVTPTNSLCSADGGTQLTRPLD